MENEDRRFTLRMPGGLRQALADAARTAGRSTNRQAVFYVGQGLRLDGYNVPRAPEKGNAPGAITPKASVSHPTAIKGS